MKIEILQSNHDRKSFDCGQGDLNKYIKQFASQHQKSGTSKTYVSIDDGKVNGFYCLSTSSMSHDSFDPELIKKLPRYPIPCIVVGRFAVDQNYQGHGIGKRLLAHALKQILKVSEIVGVNFVVIHAKDTKAMDFYKHYGFISLSSSPLTLIYPVNAIPN